MIGNKQIQEAGDNSQQIQANSIIINNGIDEKRVREIFQEMTPQAIAQYSRDAHQTALSRIALFEDKVLSKMSIIEKAVEAFSDPSFQLLLIEAQKTAASTERSADYDVLAELLAHRIVKGEDREVRAGINRAVKIVDEISDEALLGLTIIYLYSYFTPNKGGINEGLHALNDLFGSLFYRPLPTGHNWLDHLDILSTVRLERFARLYTVEEYCTKYLHGYICAGIRANSQNHERAINLIRQLECSENIIIPHELNTEYVRLDVPNKENIRSLKLINPCWYLGQPFLQILQPTDDQLKVLEDIYDLYEENPEVQQNNVSKFIEKWDNLENLRKLKVWLKNIPYAITLTSVGKVLAHANAERYNSNLPPMR